MSTEEVEELKEKRLCHDCIGEEFLSVLVQETGETAECNYCDRTAETFAIGEVAELVEQAFDQHYIRTSNEPNSWQYTLMSDRESSYDWERDGEPVVDAITNAANIPQEAAEDIQRVLEDEHGDWDNAAAGIEDEFDGDSHYEQKAASAAAWEADWQTFEASLKTEARFFSRTAAAHLASVFEGLGALATRAGDPLIIQAGPDQALTSLYRARVFQSTPQLLDALQRPDAKLGSPPTALAAAGRMNARGISVFYGADDPDTAIAEVRPPVGSRVALANFDIIRQLRLLDLTALSAVEISGSVFDPEFSHREERLMFLRSLSQRITRPVMPDDEALNYLATQAVADFLATEAADPIDGIVFPSVQSAGDERNVVLFHKAARVELVEVPETATVSARDGEWYEEGFEVDYQVVVETDEDEADEHEPPGPLPLYDYRRPGDPDSREPTLRSRLDSIKVHEVQKVKFDTSSFPVRRSVRKKWKPAPGFNPF